MIKNIKVEIKNMDGVLTRYSNQLGALGQGKARVAMARATNYGGRKTAVAVRRALAKQTSIPLALIKKVVKTRAAAHKGGGAIEFVIHASGSELPLQQFKPKQFRFGVRAKVWGKMQRFDGAFIFAGTWKSGNPAASGHVLRRTGGINAKTGRANAFEKMYGPSIPKEMVLGETQRTFQEMAAREVEKRLRHELGRMLS